MSQCPGGRTCQAPITRGGAARGWRGQEPGRDLGAPGRALPGKPLWPRGRDRDARLPGWGTEPAPRPPPTPPAEAASGGGGGSRGRRAALEPEPGEESRAARAGGRRAAGIQEAPRGPGGEWGWGPRGRDPGEGGGRRPRGRLRGSEAPVRGAGRRRGVPPAPAAPLRALAPAPSSLSASVCFITCEMGAGVGRGVARSAGGRSRGPQEPSAGIRGEEALQPTLEASPFRGAGKGQSGALRSAFYG